MSEEITIGKAVRYYNKSKVFQKSYQFSVELIRFCKELKALKEYEISRQLLKSGTSIGANIIEASAGYSKKDFCHKMSIASKEARETLYWLSLIEDCKLIKDGCDPLINNCNEIIRMLTSIIKSSKP